MLPFGTKGRAIAGYAVELARRCGGDATAAECLLYSGCPNGYGPVISALAAHLLGRRCHVVLSPNLVGGGRPARPREALDYPSVRMAAELGAKITVAANWGDMNRIAGAAAAEPDVLWLPLGLDEPVFEEMLAGAVRSAAAGSALAPLTAGGKARPRRAREALVWVVGGTGLVARALARALPGAAVQVTPATPRRRAKLERSFAGTPGRPITVHDQAAKRHRPPYPSVSGYDSRAWDAATAGGGFSLAAQTEAPPRVRHDSLLAKPAPCVSSQPEAAAVHVWNVASGRYTSASSALSKIAAKQETLALFARELQRGEGYRRLCLELMRSVAAPADLRGESGTRTLGADEDERAREASTAKSGFVDRASLEEAARRLGAECVYGGLSLAASAMPEAAEADGRPTEQPDPFLSDPARLRLAALALAARLRARGQTAAARAVAAAGSVRAAPNVKHPLLASPECARCSVPEAVLALLRGRWRGANGGGENGFLEHAAALYHRYRLLEPARHQLAVRPAVLEAFMYHAEAQRAVRSAQAALRGRSRPGPAKKILFEFGATALTAASRRNGTQTAWSGDFPDLERRFGSAAGTPLLGEIPAARDGLSFWLALPIDTPSGGASALRAAERELEAAAALGSPLVCLVGFIGRAGPPAELRPRLREFCRGRIDRVPNSRMVHSLDPWGSSSSCAARGQGTWMLFGTPAGPDGSTDLEKAFRLACA